MKKSISVANLVCGIGGIVTLLFSFFSFYKLSKKLKFNAWDTDGAAWLSTIPAILAIAMIVWVALELAGVALPKQVLTFNSNQLKATWGISATGIMLAFAITDGPDKGIGLWFMFLGSIAMGVGAVLALLGMGGDMVNLGGGTGGAPAASSPTPPPPPPPAN